MDGDFSEYRHATSHFNETLPSDAYMRGDPTDALTNQGLPYQQSFGSDPAPGGRQTGQFSDYPEISEAVADTLPGATGTSPAAPFQSTPLRLACAGPSFQLGGVEQHTRSLARFLDPHRVQLTRCLVTNASYFDRAAGAAMPFPVVPCNLAQLSNNVRDCDVLLIWGESFNEALAAVRPKVVFLAHGESWWTRKALEGSHRVVDHVIAVSKRVKERVCQGFPTTAILNGVDASRLSQTRPRDAVRHRFGFGPEDFVVGSVARLTREKQLHLLIEAVAVLPPQFKLLLVGYGPRRDELLNHANDRIPGRYALTAADDFLGDYYRAMDAFSLVSAHEGFGLVIPEAMLCERPVIVTEVGCVPEVVRDRVNGLVVAPDPVAIADAALLLRAHPNWARGLAAEGREFADTHLHAARMALDYEDLLVRLASGKLDGKARLAR